MPGTGLYSATAVPTKLDRTQSGPPVGQVITTTVGGFGTAAAYAGGYVENMTRVEVRATVSHTDDALTLEGNLANWLDTDDLDVYDSWDVVQDTFDQLSTDQVGATFVEEQEIRIFVGAFTETLALNAALRPTDQFRLLIRANTNDAVTLQHAATSVLDGNAVDSVTVEGITFNGTSGGADHSEIVDPGRGWIVDGCTFSGTCDHGIYDNGYGILFKDCTFSGNHDVYSAWMIEAGIARRCTFRKEVNLTQGGMTFSFEDCTFDAVFVRVVIDNDEPVAPLGLRLVHCNFYNAAQAVLSVVTGVGPSISPFVRNCIFETMTSAVFFNAAAITFAPIDSDRNCFNNCAAIAPGISTLAAWQTATDGDANSIETDPLMTDPAADDFSLRSDSPCRRAGAGAGVDVDYLGVAFDPYHPDIGVWSGTATITSPTWPATLPQTVDQPQYSEGFADVVARSEMDSGPAKVRRRFTSGIQAFSATTTLTAAQVVTLQTFFDTTLQGGSLTFQWDHPRTGAAAEFRFTSPPVVTPRGPTAFVASLALEIMP